VKANLKVWNSIPNSRQTLTFTGLKKFQANANQQVCHKLCKSYLKIIFLKVGND